MKQLFTRLNRWIKNRVLLSYARSNWSYSIGLWKQSMEDYSRCLRTPTLSLRYAEGYLRQANRNRADAEAAASAFGLAAKKEPTLIDAMLIYSLGWFYIID